MANPTKHESFNYVEFPATDLTANKAFFQQVFDWSFVDYGPDYSSFSEGSLDGGFYRSELSSTTAKGAALLVFYSSALKETKAKVEQHGGVICQDVFDFPGGCRFHFLDPSGNEFAVWSEQA